MSLITRTYTFTDGTTAYGSQVDSEVANIVNTMNSLDQGNTTWSNVKVTTLLPQTDVNCGGHRLTSVGTPTTSGDAAQYPITASQITALTITNTQLAAGAALANLGSSLSSVQLWQIVSATTTTITSTTSATYQGTALTANITPSSTAHKIKITVFGVIGTNNPSTDFPCVTVKRGSTDLGSSSAQGLATLITGGTATTEVPCTIIYYDSPSTTSSTTYQVFIKANSGGAATVSFCMNTQTATMLLEEIG